MSAIENKIKGRTKKTRRTDKQNFYVTSEQIYGEWKIWKQTGEITDQFGKYMLDIAKGVSNKPSFRNFSKDFKEDMVQSACLAIIKNLKNLKEEYRDGFFNYLTRTVYCAFYQVLNKYYKGVNRRRELLKNALEEVFMLNPTAEHMAIIRELEEQIRFYDKRGDDEQDEPERA